MLHILFILEFPVIANYSLSVREEVPSASTSNDSSNGKYNIIF